MYSRLVGIGLSALMLVSAVRAQVSMCGSGQHTDWSKEFLDGNKYYLGNFPYGEQGGWHCIKGNNVSPL